MVTNTFGHNINKKVTHCTFYYVIVNVHYSSIIHSRHHLPMHQISETRQMQNKVTFCKIQKNSNSIMRQDRSTDTSIEYKLHKYIVKKFPWSTWRTISTKNKVTLDDYIRTRYILRVNQEDENLQREESERSNVNSSIIKKNWRKNRFSNCGHSFTNCYATWMKLVSPNSLNHRLMTKYIQSSLII